MSSGDLNPSNTATGTLPLYQIDTFSNQLYKGNPAAVVPLEQWLSDETMLAIAAENNLAETAFFVRQNDIYHIRWFTPTTEVDLCGHATLASAYVIHHYLKDKSEILKFTCMAGELQVGFKQEERKERKEGVGNEDEQWLELDFPARPPEAINIDSNIEKALGVKALHMTAARDLIVEVANEDEIRDCTPDFQALKNNHYFAVVVTAPANHPDLDFVSRFFAPKQGIDEDPVTGSSFCSLAPFWQQKLAKNKLNAYQASQRGGHVKLELQGERVKIAGQAVPYLQGQIFL